METSGLFQSKEESPPRRGKRASEKNPTHDGYLLTMSALRDRAGRERVEKITRRLQELIDKKNVLGNFEETRELLAQLRDQRFSETTFAKKRQVRRTVQPENTFDDTFHRDVENKAHAKYIGWRTSPHRKSAMLKHQLSEKKLTETPISPSHKEVVERATRLPHLMSEKEELPQKMEALMRHNQKILLKGLEQSDPIGEGILGRKECEESLMKVAPHLSEREAHELALKFMVPGSDSLVNYKSMVEDVDALNTLVFPRSRRTTRELLHYDYDKLQDSSPTSSSERKRGRKSVHFGLERSPISGQEAPESVISSLREARRYDVVPPYSMEEALDEVKDVGDVPMEEKGMEMAEETKKEVSSVEETGIGEIQGSDFEMKKKEPKMKKKDESGRLPHGFQAIVMKEKERDLQRAKASPFKIVHLREKAPLAARRARKTSIRHITTATGSEPQAMFMPSAIDSARFKRSQKSSELDGHGDILGWSHSDAKEHISRKKMVPTVQKRTNGRHIKASVGENGRVDPTLFFHE